MRRTDKIVVTIPTEGLGGEARQRLWHILIGQALEGGGESFSVQPELLGSDAPPAVSHDRQALLGHLELRMDQAHRAWLRPTRWPVDAVVEWLKRIGPWVYRVTFWQGSQWILESSTWGKTFQVVAPPEVWEELRRGVELPDVSRNVTTRQLRKLGDAERRGWSLSRPVRRVVSLMTGLGAGLIATLSGADLVDRLSAAVGVMVAVFFLLPKREPGPFDRLIARAELPTDPMFNRRFGRLLGLSVVGGAVSFFAGGAGALAEPGSLWRIAWWSLAVSGLIAAAISIGVTLWWMLKYQRR